MDVSAGDPVSTSYQHFSALVWIATDNGAIELLSAGEVIFTAEARRRGGSWNRARALGVSASLR